jgi:hypothetical protein
VNRFETAPESTQRNEGRNPIRQAQFRAPAVVLPCHNLVTGCQAEIETQLTLPIEDRFVQTFFLFTLLSFNAKTKTMTDRRIRYVGETPAVQLLLTLLYGP